MKDISKTLVIVAHLDISKSRINKRWVGELSLHPEKPRAERVRLSGSVQPLMSGRAKSTLA
jgi:hypothetical protein